MQIKLKIFLNSIRVRRWLSSRMLLCQRISHRKLGYHQIAVVKRRGVADLMATRPQKIRWELETDKNMKIFCLSYASPHGKMNENRFIFGPIKRRNMMSSGEICKRIPLARSTSSILARNFYFQMKNLNSAMISYYFCPICIKLP